MVFSLQLKHKGPVKTEQHANRPEGETREAPEKTLLSEQPDQQEGLKR